METRLRSHSYDSSFLNHRKDDSDLVTLEPPSLSGEETPRRRAAEAPPVLRTNFGKTLTYLPPTTPGWDIYRQNSLKSDVEPVEDDKSVPFDQEVSETNHVKDERLSVDAQEMLDAEYQHRLEPKVSPTDVKKFPGRELQRQISDNRPFDEPMPTKEYSRTTLTDFEESPNRTPRNRRPYDSDQDWRLQVPPPRISGPTSSLFYPTSEEDADLSLEVQMNGNGPRSNLDSSYETFVVPTDQEDATDATWTEIREPATHGDDDSLFDFGAKGRRQSQSAMNSKRRSRNARRSQPLYETDDTSLDQHYGEQSLPRSLPLYETDDTSLDQPYGEPPLRDRFEERSYRAWTKRKAAQRGKASQDANEQATNQESERSSQGAQAPRGRDSQIEPPSVSFGKGHTVQYYNPDPAVDDTLETSTLGGRSLNSYYTKSAESEMEDLIKDIFLIGSARASNPGRRKLKYSPAVQQRLAGDQAVDDDTLETIFDEVDDETQETSKESTRQVDSYGVSSTTATDPSSVPDPSSVNSLLVPASKGVDSKGKVEDDPLAHVWDFLFGVAGAKKSDSTSKDTTTGAKKESSVTAGGLGDLLSFASDVLLGPSPTELGDEPVERKKSTRENVTNIAVKSGVKPARVALEEDLRLLQLAVQAARCSHRIRGHEFDESYSIKISSDIKFCVVDLEMPLGLIFQENETGCWVTKVLPNGSASRNGKVQVADQLAAIDGVSAIDMKVGDLANSVTGKKSEVELTFLRYVGKLHPVVGSVMEEGYEVPARAQSNQVAVKQRRGFGLRQSVNPTAQQLEKRRFRLFGRKKSANRE